MCQKWYEIPKSESTLFNNMTNSIIVCFLIITPLKDLLIGKITKMEWFNFVTMKSAYIIGQSILKMGDRHPKKETRQELSLC